MISSAVDSPTRTTTPPRRPTFLSSQAPAIGWPQGTVMARTRSAGRPYLSALAAMSPSYSGQRLLPVSAMAEKFGSPYLWGKYPRGAAQEDIDDLAQKLEAAVQDAVFVTPDDASVQILEAAAKASSSALYKDLKSTSDIDIAIAILGQNLTTDVQGGSRAAAEVHGPLAIPAHHQQREGVAGEQIARSLLALLVTVGNRSKIGPVKCFRHLAH